MRILRPATEPGEGCLLPKGIPYVMVNGRLAPEHPIGLSIVPAAWNPCK
jgi:hypothetical protein